MKPIIIILFKISMSFRLCIIIRNLSKKISIAGFFFLLSLFLSCTSFFKKEPIPSFVSNPDLSFCSTDENWKPIINFIQSEIRSSNWEDVQSRYSTDANPGSRERSLALQKSRNLLGTCITILYGGIPTGSNRNLKEIDENNALKDLDITLSVENLPKAEKWLFSKIAEPERVLLISLLMDPIENLPCGRLTGEKLEACALEVSRESLQIILLSRKSLIKKTGQICEGRWDIPDESSSLSKLTSQKTPEEFEKFTAYAKIENPDIKKRYFFYYLSSNNPAYYVQPGSLRKWVIEREPDFKKRFESEFSTYSKTSPEPEIEGAFLEQWIHSIENEKFFYYKYKYIFRALSHINYDFEKNLSDLFHIHRLVKKKRPETLKEVYTTLMYLKNQDRYKSDEFFIKYPNLFEYREFLWIIERAENTINLTLKNAINEKRKTKYSVINSMCRL